MALGGPGALGVEVTHQILDQSFEEDTKPWVLNDPNGMLVVLVLRRIAYTLLTLYRFRHPALRGEAPDPLARAL